MFKTFCDVPKQFCDVISVYDDVIPFKMAAAELENLKISIISMLVDIKMNCWRLIMYKITQGVSNARFFMFVDKIGLTIVFG